MLEIVNNTAAALTLLIAFSLPFMTYIDLESTPNSRPKMQLKPQQSVLELPLITEAYEPKDLQTIQNINMQLNGLVTVFAVPPTNK